MPLRSWLPLAALLLCACPAEEPKKVPAEPEVSAPQLTCPPCGMKMPADAELQEIAGHLWAVCNERCASMIEQSPAQFLEQAAGVASTKADSDG